jgi:thioredoxin reductase (NADPH)
VNTYPGKLKLILCGFTKRHCNVRQLIKLSIQAKYVLKYTTVAGVDGFDGTRKKRQKQWLRPLFNILNKNNKKI